MQWRRWAGAGLGLTFLLIAGIVWTRGSATSAADSDVAAGQQIYATHCATCHGDAGKGDGASAAGFATKPPDLTDGRLMNALPDRFLVEVIRGGGPAHGLAPTMPPFDRTLSEAQIGEVVAYVRSLAGLTSKDAAPSRNDDLNPHPAENRLPATAPKPGGVPPPATQMPQ